MWKPEPAGRSAGQRERGSDEEMSDAGLIGARLARTDGADGALILGEYRCDACMRACVHACMYVCTDIYMYVHMYMCSCVCECVCVCVCVCACLPACMHRVL